MKVYEIMTKNIICIKEDYSILETMKIMKNNNIDFLIIEENKRILGSILDKDIFIHLTKELSTSTKINKIMNKYVLTINENDDVVEACDLMGRCLSTKLAVNICFVFIKFCPPKILALNFDASFKLLVINNNS